MSAGWLLRCRCGEGVMRAEGVRPELPERTEGVDVSADAAARVA